MKVLGIMLLCGLTLASTSMESLERSDFGKALSESIQLQLKLEGGVDVVIGMIDDLASDIQAEQDQHDGEFANKTEECNTALAKYQANIDQAAADRTQANADLAKYRPELEQAQSDLAENQLSLQQTEDEKKSAEDARVLAIEEYNANVQEHNLAIKACDDAVALVKDYYGGNQTGTFLQKRQVLVQVTSHVQAVRRVAPSFAPILKSLVQLSAAPQADQEKIKKVIELIESLRNKLEQSLNDEHAAEEAAKQAYDELIAALTATINNLKSEINRLTAKIADLEGKIEDAEDRLEDANNRFETNTTLYNDKNDECNAYYAHYESESARRTDEISVCNEANALLRERFADKSDYVMSKVENVE